MSNPLLEDTVPARSTGKTKLTPESRLVGFVSFAVLLMVSFSQPLFALVRYAAHDNLNSYILLVPFVSAYLFYIRREQLPAEYRTSLPSAAVLLVIGVATLATALMYHAALSRNDYLALTTLSFICLFIAGGFAFLGGKWMRASAFPFAFLFFMVPMPLGMAATLENGLKLASAEAASMFFNMAGTPVLREGTFFQLPNILIEVARECSGIRSSWVLVMTSLIASNLFLKSNWRRAILVLFVVPLGIIRNGFRVFVIGTLCIRYGPEMIHSIIHRRGGPIFFALSLVPLFVFLWWLRRGEAQRQTREELRTEVRD